jgi:CheY-like chemotaxis protein
MRRLLVIEDGTEYTDFARLFLSEAFEVRSARSASEALELASREPFDAFLMDLRFESSDERTLIGDPAATAERLFAGDQEAAVRYLRDNQGALVTAELRRAGHDQPVLFVHDFPQGRLENLRRLYGDVQAVASFDAMVMLRLLGGAR